nr:MAG TPA: chromosomal replication initiator protein [Caudoviricetes sp.]
MKVYISGQVSGLEYEDARARFDKAEDFLKDIGVDVVNPMDNGLPEESTWIQHLCKDLELLNDCSHIYMIDGWQLSRGACIEYDFAVRTGKTVLFESAIVRDRCIALRVESAIHEVTGLKLSDYSVSGRTRDVFFARMLFAHHCQLENMKLSDIGSLINRERTLVTCTLNDYNKYFKYNAFFRSMAERVDEILRR